MHDTVAQLFLEEYMRLQKNLVQYRKKNQKMRLNQRFLIRLILLKIINMIRKNLNHT